MNKRRASLVFSHLLGCIFDGAAIEEAIANGADVASNSDRFR